jgi:hypothetical protein
MGVVCCIALPRWNRTVFVADALGYASHVIAMFRVTVITSSCGYCGFVNPPFRFFVPAVLYYCT